MIGASAGLTLRYPGLLGRFFGSCPRAALMAACTSLAAASMLRLRSNCMVMEVEPIPLDDVISVIPAIRPNCRSRGVATEEAMVSGLAPGRPADTLIVGNSTWGRGETGRNLYPIAPARAMAMTSRVVATGRRMKGAERFTSRPPEEGRRFFHRAGPWPRAGHGGTTCRRPGRSPGWCRGSASG